MTAVTRRTGRALDEALLEAGWDQLVQGGYASFTMDAVAARARTSRPVLYRRWSDKHDLLLAVITHVLRPEQVQVPDTGSLRGDTIAMMRIANTSRLELVTAITVYLSGYYQETGTSPTDLRKTLFPSSPHLPRVLLDRAIARGEFAPAFVSDRMAAVPYALQQQEFLMTLRPVPEATIVEIIDTVFFPLLRGQKEHEPARLAPGRETTSQH